MRKSLLAMAVAAVCMVGVSAYAGGGAVVAPVSHTGAYVELNTGWANRHLSSKNVSYYNPITGETFAVDTDGHTDNAWTVGGDVGYQFMNNFGVELGGNWMQNAKYDYTAGTLSGKLSLDNWVAYLAGKLSVPVYDQLSLFAKAGVGYQRQTFKVTEGTHSSDDLGLGKKSAWVPVFAVGANYDINDNLFTGLQYMRYASKEKINTSGDVWLFTAKDLVTVSLGYKFQV